MNARLTPDSQKFLHEIFGDDLSGVFLTDGRNYHRPRHVDDPSLNLEDREAYYSCARFVPGARNRATVNVDRVMAVVIDDIGTKIDRDDFELAAPEPVSRVETSPGNFQAVYAIEGGASVEEYRTLRASMNTHPIWGNADGNTDPVHWWRLPQGAVTKDDPLKKGFVTRPMPAAGRRRTLAELQADLGGPGAGKAQRSSSDAEIWRLSDDMDFDAILDVEGYDGLSGDLRARFEASEAWNLYAEGATTGDMSGSGHVFQLAGRTAHAGFTGTEFGCLATAWDLVEARNVEERQLRRAWVRARQQFGAGAEEAFDDDPEAAEIAAAPDLSVDETFGTRHFMAYLPTKKYIYLATGDLWVKDSINSVIQPVVVGTDGDGEPITVKAATWLDRNAAVTQMSWLPGQPWLVRGMAVSEDGLEANAEAAVYNSYVAPKREAGDANRAGPWLKHVKALYPEDCEHLFDFFAHAVQKPWEKVNHGILMGGAPGIGKDTLLHPVVKAVGYRNTTNISPSRIREAFNGYLKSVILIVDEIRDIGDTTQWTFYEQTKTLLAAPPATLLVNEKFKPASPVPNVVHVIMTTNSKCDGLYLPEDDRRHYVAWSHAVPGNPEDIDVYFRGLWGWLEDGGGTGHVAAWLRARDLSEFKAKMPPRQTKAFFDIVAANRPAEEGAVSDALDAMGRPQAFTIDWLQAAASNELAGWLAEPKHRRHIPKRLEREGYEMLHNPDAKDGRWRVAGKKQVIYVRRDLAAEEKHAAAAGIEVARQAALDAIFRAGGGN